MREFIIRTKNYLLILLVIYIAYLAYNYFQGKNAPECADEITVNNVYTIFKNKLLPNGGLTKEQIAGMDIKLSKIVTLDKNSNTGAYFCQGDLTIKFKGEDATRSIKYNNRLVEDGDKNQFLTTVTNY